MNEPMFLNLVKMYINSLNGNNLPDINTSWKIVIDSQLKAAFSTAIDYYMNEMDNLDYKTYYTSDKLFIKHYQLREKAMSYTMEFSYMNIPSNIFIDIIQNLEKRINDEFINIII